MESITAKKLKQKLIEKDNLLVINTLDEDHYKDRRIPVSRNAPFSREGFIKAVERLAGSKDRELVVYCASHKCDSSTKAAQALEKAGFTNVVDFEGGLNEWEKAGYNVVGEAAGVAV